MKKFQYESRVSLNNLLDKLLGTTLQVGSSHGLRPDYATVKEMRRGLKKALVDKCQDIVNSFLCQDIGYTYFLAGNRGNASSP